MGIRDRDYMKRPSDDDGRRGGSSESDLEEWVGRIFRNKRRLILYAGIGLGVLIVVAFLMARFGG